MNCSFLLLVSSVGYEGTEVRSEMKKTPAACTEDVTHMKMAGICVRLRGEGVWSTKLGFGLCFTATLSSNPHHRHRKVLYSLEKWHCSPNPIAPDFDPEKKKNWPREPLKLNWWRREQGKPARMSQLWDSLWIPAAEILEFPLSGASSIQDHG